MSATPVVLNAEKSAALVSMIVDHGVLRYRMGCATNVTHKDLALQSEMLLSKIQAAITALASQPPAQPSAEMMLLAEAVKCMDRARNILTNGNPRPECRWGMLDTSKLRAATPPTVDQSQPADVAGSDAKDAARYRLLKRGQHWSVINGVGDTLRGDSLDHAIDRAIQNANAGENKS